MKSGEGNSSIVLRMKLLKSELYLLSMLSNSCQVSNFDVFLFFIFFLYWKMYLGKQWQWFNYVVIKDMYFYSNLLFKVLERTDNFSLFKFLAPHMILQIFILSLLLSLSWTEQSQANQPFFCKDSCVEPVP